MKVNPTRTPLPDAPIGSTPQNPPIGSIHPDAPIGDDPST